jgi:hypothetical protein
MSAEFSDRLSDLIQKFTFITAKTAPNHPVVCYFLGVSLTYPFMFGFFKSLFENIIEAVVIIFFAITANLASSVIGGAIGFAIIGGLFTLFVNEEVGVSSGIFFGVPLGGIGVAGTSVNIFEKLTWSE